MIVDVFSTRFNDTAINVVYLDRVYKNGTVFPARALKTRSVRINLIQSVQISRLLLILVVPELIGFTHTLTFYEVGERDLRDF